MLEISQTLLNTTFGLKKDAYDKAVKTLIDEQFLVKKSHQHYDFIEYPEEHKRTPINSKSGQSPLLNVGSNHNQKSGKPTFKSGDCPQDNNTHNIPRITHNNSVTREQSSDTGGQFNSDTEEAIYWPMFNTGFTDMPTKRNHILTIRQLLSEGYNPSDIWDAITAVSKLANRTENPIEDALSFLYVKVGRDVNGWGYDDTLKYRGE